MSDKIFLILGIRRSCWFAENDRKMANAVVPNLSFQMLFAQNKQKLSIATARISVWIKQAPKLSLPAFASQ